MANKVLEGFNKVAVVKFTGCDIQYCYALYDDDVFAGDTVLLDNDRTALVEVVVPAEEASQFTSKKIISEVVCKVDISKYELRKKQREEKVKLREQMNKRKTELQKLRDDEYYAGFDPEYKSMFEAYKNIKV